VKLRHLGRSVLQVTTLGLGTNSFGHRIGAEQSARVLREALDSGINFIDTANSYGNGRSEEFIGETVVGQRHRVVLATKVGSLLPPGRLQRGGAPRHYMRQVDGSRSHIMQEVELSLKRLRTDYIDLYQVHFPDPRTPIEETLRALDDLVQQGKVRHIGCSNFSAWQTCESVWTSRTLNLSSFVTVQMEYNLLHRDIEQEGLPFCHAYQMGIIPYLPLAGGLLTGKYRAGEPAPEGSRLATNPRLKQRYHKDHNLVLVARLSQFAADRRHTVGELAIAWLLGNPLVCSVIAGAMKPEQVAANVKGAEWHLTPKEMLEIKALLDGQGDPLEG